MSPQALASAMAAAALPFLGSRERASELANNVAGPVCDGDDAYQTALEMIMHREHCFALWCADRSACARAMAECVRRPVLGGSPAQRELLERVADLWPEDRAKDDEPARGVDRALELWRAGQW